MDIRWIMIILSSYKNRLIHTSGEDLFKWRINPGAVMTWAVNSDIISGGYWHSDNILKEYYIIK